ncbi:hypothetical protein D3C78_910350 [compost metagenome]
MTLSRPPKPGPIVNPSPIDIPTSPIPFVRFSAVVISATYATITEATAPEKKPPRIRDRYISIKFPEDNPNSKKLSEKPSTPTRIIGLRPIRSDMLPHNGDKKKDIAEYTASIHPVCSSACSGSASCMISGITGMIMPNPINVVIKIAITIKMRLSFIYESLHSLMLP